MKFRKFSFGSVVMGACAISLLTGCATVGVVKAPVQENEVIITPEFKKFLDAQDNVSVVLRVPFTAERVSQSEQKDVSKYDTVYNRIEKNLLKAGFTVRDRGLLENLMSQSMTNYREINERIETDIIIEILGIDFAGDNYVNTATYKKNGKPMKLPAKDALNLQTAKLECKFIVVSRGLTGAMATLHITAGTDTEAGLEFVNKWNNKAISHLYEDGHYDWQNALKWDVVPDSAVDYFSACIVDILSGTDKPQ